MQLATGLSNRSSNTAIFVVHAVCSLPLPKHMYQQQIIIKHTCAVYEEHLDSECVRDDFGASIYMVTDGRCEVSLSQAAGKASSILYVTSISMNVCVVCFFR